MRTNASKQIQAINQILKQQRKSISKLKLFDLGTYEQLPKIKQSQPQKTQRYFRSQKEKNKKGQYSCESHQKKQAGNSFVQQAQKGLSQYADQDQLIKMNLSPISRISLNSKNQQLKQQMSRKRVSISQHQNISYLTTSKQLSNTSQGQFISRKHCPQIADIPFQQLKKYFIAHQQLFRQGKSPQLIYKLVRPLFDQFKILLHTPFIKQYKNCTYFGQVYEIGAIHQGFLIFQSQKKVYYGLMNTDKKHGRGTEIDFINNVVYKGIFSMGKKKGTFQVIKQTEKYIGELKNDRYQGKGKLFTDISIYNGYFSEGRRHGKGEQFFPQAGLKISGTFLHNHFTNNQKKLQDSRMGKSSSLKRSRYKSKLFQRCQNPQEMIKESRYNYQGYNFDFNCNQDYLVRQGKKNLRKSGFILKRKRSEEQQQPLARIIR